MLAICQAFNLLLHLFKKKLSKMFSPDQLSLSSDGYWVKQPAHVTHHSPASDVYVKNVWCFTSNLPYDFMVRGLALEIFIFYLENFCGHLVAGITGLNPAKGMDVVNCVYMLCCLV
jgi:hypothetical protein